ncbi:clathrin coat assembly protein AP180 [Prunus yedoensis var. nudiflora]|uniref:Clathrin coat assembly protein AP180 n=1 Tax=Prunus yedoensis var. nudiflora TaxID=2094558 RepID=A0A314YJL9_PRUYE|nr:clathrin coat assembly protein AP180 [Prunus yedoensis var. nudiflora]
MKEEESLLCNRRQIRPGNSHAHFVKQVVRILLHPGHRQAHRQNPRLDRRSQIPHARPPHFQDGDPYFSIEVLHAMKRGAKILNLSNFRDDSNSCPWDFTAFVRTFALYLDERLDCFLTGKLQRRFTYQRDQEYNSSRRSRRSNDTVAVVRDMKPAMLLDRIHYWQKLLDRAIGCVERLGH